VSNRDAVLISAEQLLNPGSQRPAILDVRWRLDQPDGRDGFLAGHVPGAVYVSLEDELSDHTRPGLGRHPLPTGGALQAAARRWGVRRDQPVVVYDDWNRAGSARAWWLLTAAGLRDVRILDGGLAAWIAAGGELQAGPVIPPAGDVDVVHDDLYAGGRQVLTADEIAEFFTDEELEKRSRTASGRKAQMSAEAIDKITNRGPRPDELALMRRIERDARIALQQVAAEYRETQAAAAA
jgi:thiosulfate/3-mercaptopyruvate sulfurtransferase